MKNDNIKFKIIIIVFLLVVIFLSFFYFKTKQQKDSMMILRHCVDQKQEKCIVPVDGSEFGKQQLDKQNKINEKYPGYKCTIAINNMSDTGSIICDKK
jgi:hypothetical protein